MAPDRARLGIAMLDALRGVNVGVAAVVIDAQGRIDRVYTNQAAADVLGYPLHELAASTAMLPIAPEELPRFHKMAAQFASGESVPPILETEVVAKDGRRTPIQVALCHGTLEDKRLTVAVLQDLTERNRVQQALASSEARFRQFAEAAPDAITVIVGGRFVYANPSAARVIGAADAAALVGQPVSALLADPQERAEMVARIEQIARGARLEPKEYTVRHADGSHLHLEISSIAIEFDGQRAILAHGRDVSERKRMQANLIRADRMATIGTLAAGVAHELNNPLAYVLLQLRRLEQRLPALVAGDEDRHEVATMIADSLGGAERVALIVRELLAFVRATDGGRGPVDLRAAVGTAAKMAATALHGRARLVVRCEGLPAVDGDEPRLVQVFLNLLVNAAQAVDPTAVDRNEIVVSARAVPGSVIVDVEDNGPGIPEANLDRVFDPFFTTKPGTGTGLGLTVSRSIIDAMGGEIRALARAGGGTCMRVTLRSWAAPVASPASRDAPTVQGATGRGRVLIIDDEPRLARALASWLQDRHDVVVCDGGVAALDAIANDGPFDVVLCDLVMPGVTGMEVHSRARDRHPDQASRFVFMTGGAVPEGGIDGDLPVLRKPLDLDLLARLISQRVR